MASSFDDANSVAGAVEHTVVSDTLSTRTDGGSNILGRDEQHPVLSAGVPELRPANVRTLHSLRELASNTPVYASGGMDAGMQMLSLSELNKLGAGLFFVSEPSDDECTEAVEIWMHSLWRRALLSHEPDQRYEAAQVTWGGAKRIDRARLYLYREGVQAIDREAADLLYTRLDARPGATREGSLSMMLADRNVRHSRRSISSQSRLYLDRISISYHLNLTPNLIHDMELPPLRVP